MNQLSLAWLTWGIGIGWSLRTLVGHMVSRDVETRLAVAETKITTHEIEINSLRRSRHDLANQIHAVTFTKQFNQNDTHDGRLGGG